MSKNRTNAKNKFKKMLIMCIGYTTIINTEIKWMLAPGISSQCGQELLSRTIVSLSDRIRLNLILGNKANINDGELEAMCDLLSRCDIKYLVAEADACLSCESNKKDISEVFIVLEDLVQLAQDFQKLLWD